MRTCAPQGAASRLLNVVNLLIGVKRAKGKREFVRVYGALLLAARAETSGC